MVLRDTVMVYINWDMPIKLSQRVNNLPLVDTYVQH